MEKSRSTTATSLRVLRLLRRGAPHGNRRWSRSYDATYENKIQHAIQHKMINTQGRKSREGDARVISSGGSRCLQPRWRRGENATNVYARDATRAFELGGSS